ncbi:de1bd2df-e27b-4a2f-9748-9a3129b5dc9c [Sclerotinia trifoliorum]|uniref:De1bd2df-e27b-4a2f-9748-9a3129b5dc9c n=1 Tax=Sclerotinia trifoliorum TaxID=28548 RepID=A0A8H2VV48_9HELO|nr:de1bd2df-e27b-4a2f-9748-9a3129b5dc9c [Sclerotinia trifoliorum]
MDVTSGNLPEDEVNFIVNNNTAKEFERAKLDRNKEVTHSPKGDHLLSRFQVACIIINRMMGTGIFESPTIIIQQDRNVGASLILWVLGFIASMAGTLMYVEYGLTIPWRTIHGKFYFVPKSGGELNYLGFLVKNPIYMAICMFSFIFIVVGNSAANCVSFAVHCLAAAGIDDSRKGAVQGIAIGTAWLVTSLHSLGRMFGIHLNSVFAVTKVSILIMVIIMGFMVLNNHIEHFHRDTSSYKNLDPKTSFEQLSKGDHARGFAAAYLNVIFTCGGWNQANYVLGEIRKPMRTFRGISLWTVGIMCTLYLLTNISYMIVVTIPQDGIFIDGETVIEQFFQRTIGQAWNERRASQVMDVCLAISSLGNVIVTTFTAARVKQEIAKEGILPFSLVFAGNRNIIEWALKKLGRPAQNQQVAPGIPAQNQQRASGIPAQNQQGAAGAPVQPKSDPIPLPALVLHGVFSTILILASLRIPHSKDAYSLLVEIYTYPIDAMVAICLSLGMILMRSTKSSEWNTHSTSNRWFSLATAVVVFVANAFPVAALWIPESNPGSSIPWYVVPTIGWTLVLGGFIYYLVFRFAVPRLLRGQMLEVQRKHFYIRDDEGYYVQKSEIVEHKWSVPRYSDRTQFDRQNNSFGLPVIEARSPSSL